MQLSEEAINKFYKTLIEIVEDRYDVKIEYRVVKKGAKEDEEEKKTKQKKS